MSTLEQLVLPIELCQQIPQGAFADSALVWAYTGNRYEVISREVWNIVKSIFPGISAPPLEEIMAVLPIGTIIQQDAPGVWVGIVNAGAPGIVIEKADRPSTAALRLWLRLKENIK